MKTSHISILINELPPGTFPNKQNKKAFIVYAIEKETRCIVNYKICIVNKPSGKPFKIDPVEKMRLLSWFFSPNKV